MCSCSDRDLSGSVGRTELLLAMAIRKLAGVLCAGRNDRHEGAAGVLLGGIHFRTDLRSDTADVLLHSPTCGHSQ